eukprot:CAMPEP_0198647850 /NCGR_PEP_ID=MMETSP1467-20131203/3051_1 /TAXON_ID=1462469 /ORGANISM="unid. sp., Strain CCMP2135" /LENGTH=729 /DNA_ID=CAMNT_0044383519 /DNA_START=25 /DNA_END=2214 /DNA_ORIENTATION=+
MMGSRVRASPGWIRGGRVDPAEEIELEFWLRHDPEDVARFEETLLALATPGSPTYAQWLTPDQVVAELAPSREAVRTVVDFLAEETGRNASVHKLRSIVAVTAPAATVERVLETKLYKWTDEPESHDDDAYVARCAEEGGYSLPADVAVHVAVVSDIMPRFPSAREFSSAPKKTTRTPTRPMPSSSSSDSAAEPPRLSSPWTRCGTQFEAYTNPWVLAARYGFAVPYSGAEPSNSIAVASFLRQFYDQRDLNWFSTVCDLGQIVDVSQRFGLNHPVRCDPKIVFNPGCVESLLDLEYAGSIAGDVPLEVYYQRRSFLRLFSKLQASDDPPKVVSISYAEAELFDNETSPQWSVAYLEATETALMKVGAMGISVLAPAGDGGTNWLNAAYPASSPYCTAVGGTDFLTPSTIGDEVAWSGGGSGFSKHFRTPVWQAAEVRAYLEDGGGSVVNRSRFNAAGRGYPDISALAGAVNPYLVLEGTVSAVLPASGTSASTPVIAATVAQLNDHLLKQGKRPLGYLNPFLYAAGTQGAFHDVTFGNTYGSGERDSGFSAGPGWDAATGWGTPDFDRLLAVALEAQGATLPPAASPTTTASGQQPATTTTTPPSTISPSSAPKPSTTTTAPTTSPTKAASAMSPTQIVPTPASSNATAVPPSLASSNNKSSKKDNSKESGGNVLIGVLVGFVVAFAAMVFFLFRFERKKRIAQRQNFSETPYIQLQEERKVEPGTGT